MSEKIENGASQVVSEQQASTEENKISRRKFLQILGTASAVGAVGCADPATQNIYPYVKGDDTQVPGVSVWYRSTCTECAAGCGIEVRTREGRAVKIEGSRENPINRGGLCAIGQSSLQHLYDPDRIRQPLKRDGSGFKAITWDQAFAELGAILKKSNEKTKGPKYFVTGQKTGTVADLLAKFCQDLGVEQVSYEAIDQSDLAQATKEVFGVYGIPQYHFDKADAVLSFGADFLETWISPCEYARDWSSLRRGKNLSKVIQIEPRLSLTGGNADLWICNKPGSEALIARLLLKLLAERGRGAGVDLSRYTAGISVDQVADEAGISKEKLLTIADALASAKSALVIAGGASASSAASLELQVLAALLNSALGSVGTTVSFDRLRVPQTSVTKLNKLIAELKKTKKIKTEAGEDAAIGLVDVLFVHGTNPAFSLPMSFGFEYAAKNAGTIVSFSSHMDETTALANLVLPASTSLESWGDVNVVEGLYSLVQPAMTPVFNTLSVGDILLGAARQVGKELAASADETFESYLKRNWEKIHAASGAGGAFEDFWRKSVERGGYFKAAAANRAVKATVPTGIISTKSEASEFAGEGLVYLPYSSIRAFDGSAANRPWLHELPDPVTKVVWDSWAEINPATAASKGIAQGDFVTIRTDNGELNVPAYLTEYVHQNVIAVPLGQGHKEFGRYAKTVGGGNAFDLLPAVVSQATESLALLSTKALVMRGRGQAILVNTQGSNSQLGRDLARSSEVTAAGVAVAAAEAHAEGHGEHGEAAEHHAPKQMYEQREHPLYRWAMAVDLAACTGCSACVVACYAENNIPVVGKHHCKQGREMSWLRIERYYEGPVDELKVSFLPMMCQHCGNAPCEPVCPVFATYHNEEGLNAMIYNRCVGTRYCSNNCSYKVRRFNWFEFDLPEPLNLQINPDVVKRTMGVIEKCTFCVQRITEGKDKAKDLGRTVQDGEIQPACVQSCPTQALTFGNLNDLESRVAKLGHEERAYKVLDHHINTQPGVTYLEDIRVKI